MTSLTAAGGAAPVSGLTLEDYRLLVDSVRDYAIFMLDVNGNVASWNLGAELIKGYTREEIVGRHFSIFYPPAALAQDKPQRELEIAARTGRAEDEGPRVRKDGTLFWANVVITALRDESGVLRGFAKVTRDLSQRRAAEEELLHAEERFHQLVDAVTDYAIFRLDAAGRVATWNAGAERIKGYRSSEIIGQHFSKFYTEQDRAAGEPERILDRVRREGRYEAEAYRVRKDGAAFWASVVITPLRGPTGDVIGYAKVTRDLTERELQAEALRSSEERFRLLIAGVTDYAIYMLDPEGRVTTWNVGAERMKGYTADEIIGKSFAAFFPAADVAAGKPAAELREARERGRFEDEGFRVRKDGTKFWANVAVSALWNDNHEFIGYAKVTRDLTERKQAEEIERRLLREQAARTAVEESERRLRASEEAARRAVKRAEDAVRRAEDANRLKDEFLGTVSHELRTPLNAILGWSSILRDRLTDPSLTKGAEVIQRNAQAQVRLVDDILDVSRIITGKLRLDPQAMDLSATVNEAIEVVRASAAAKDITIHLVGSNEPVRLVGDGERLRQVAWNLLSNAVKFTDRGGAIFVDVQPENSKVRLTVRDTGRGIEADFLPYVFERFKQADSTTTRRFGGLGLGLAIVRHIVELHGGQVEALSPGRGQGASFTVTLPVRAVAQVPQSPSDAATPATGNTPLPVYGPLQALRVLVVDDEEDARDLLQNVLESAGAIVQTADSAASAFESVQRFRPGLLISDVGMPGEDGYALIQRLRSLPASEGGGIPSIALTAYTRAQDRTKALASGFTTHIGKPVDPEDLLAAVANLAAFVPR